MKWILALHLIVVICWFAGLFYLPRLFVYHANCKDEIGNTRFKLMERKLFNGIILPSTVLTILTGIYLLLDGSWKTAGAGFWWMRLKLLLVGFLLVYVYYCWKYLRAFKMDRNQHHHVFYRWFNEVPTVILIAIIILAILKPF
jgi:protoporphyrinogen IX oxidase